MTESKSAKPESTGAAPATTPSPAPEAASSSGSPPKEDNTNTNTNTDLKTVHSSPPRSAPLSATDETASSPSRNDLITQATLFLETAEVRDAPLDKKIEFLRSKGLSEEEAKRLASTISSPPISPASSSSNQVARVPASPPAFAAAPPAPAPVATPPILTYPEFLAPPPPPPAAPAPISASTLLKATYFAAASAATIYTANSLILSPMLNSLTAARLDFSATVSKNLDTLTTKLLELAPSNYTPPQRSTTPKPSADDDDDCAISDTSSASDPTELFHVDAAVQTSPPNEEADEEEKELGPDGKLEELTNQMKVLVDAHSDGTDNELTFLLEDLTGYLEGLKESGLAATMYSSPFGGFQTGKDKDKDDPIMKVKQEIRSVKGVLLHTKNFPATRMTSVRRNPELTS